jgi:hypothetical protein
LRPIRQRERAAASSAFIAEAAASIATAVKFSLKLLQTGAESVSTRFSPFWPFTILEAAQVYLRLDTKIGYTQSRPLPPAAGLI